MEFRIISSRVRVNVSEHSPGLRVVFFEDDGKSRCTVFLKYDDSARELIRQLQEALDGDPNTREPAQR